MSQKKLIGFAVAILLTAIVWLLPDAAFHVDGLTTIEHRLIAIFVFAAVMWITEPIPIWGTSVLIMVLMLLTTSNSMLGFLNHEGVGATLKYKDIMAAFADPTIMLFMGGFVLAIGATKVKLDATLARAIIKPFGSKPKYVMLGFISVTALLSMFMSNTATAAMMIAILSPVLAAIPESDNKGRVGLALAIPIAANIGGIGSPIGTPPNVVATGWLEKIGIEIGFGQWMALMVPVAVIILFFSWLMLTHFFPSQQESIDVQIEGEVDKSPKAMIVYITFAVTVFLWVFGKALLGINTYVVALIPFAVFCMTGIFGKKDFALIDWDVLWLVAGGFALGVGLEGKIAVDTATGEAITMSKHIVSSIPFDSWPVMAVIIGSGILCIVMSTFMSHSATAALLIPIFVAVAQGMEAELAPFGGATTLIVGLALSASFAMCLPISTPPNAIAYSKGFIKLKYMALTGLFVGVLSLVVGYAALFAFGEFLH